MNNLITIILPLTTGWLTAQNILHVNPAFDDGVSNFSDLQAAIEGDEIRVYSGRYTGAITVDKRLNIIGRGYSLVENYPNVNTNISNARISTLCIEPGGDGTLAQGVEVADIRIKGATNCIIERNLLQRFMAYDASVLVIRNNFIDGSDGGCFYTSMSGCGYAASSGIIFTKNIGNIVITMVRCKIKPFAAHDS